MIPDFRTALHYFELYNSAALTFNPLVFLRDWLLDILLSSLIGVVFNGNPCPRQDHDESTCIRVMPGARNFCCPACSHRFRQNRCALPALATHSHTRRTPPPIAKIALGPLPAPSSFGVRSSRLSRPSGVCPATRDSTKNPQPASDTRAQKKNLLREGNTQCQTKHKS